MQARMAQVLTKLMGVVCRKGLLKSMMLFKGTWPSKFSKDLLLDLEGCLVR